MTTIDPIASSQIPTSVVGGAQTAPTTNTNNGDQFGKDTFLKLLVAQLKYQNPMSPADGTQFLAQTAQFTMVEKLQEIGQTEKANSAAIEVLEAGSMIAKNVTVATKAGTPAVTTVDHFGGVLSNDEAVGKKVSVDTDVFTSKGTKVPMKIEFTKLADGADGSHHWSGRAMVSTTQIGPIFSVDFDRYGERTSPDVTLAAPQLDAIPDSKGLWNSTGIRLDLGAAGDVNRLRTATGATTTSSFGQDGTDGTTISGVVTGVQFTANGPLLTIAGKEYALTDVTEVHVTS